MGSHAGDTVQVVNSINKLWGVLPVSDEWSMMWVGSAFFAFLELKYHKRAENLAANSGWKAGGDLRRCHRRLDADATKRANVEAQTIRDPESLPPAK